MKYSYLYGAKGTPIHYRLSTYRDKTRFVIVAFLSSLAVFGITASQLAHVNTNIVKASPGRSNFPEVTASEAPQQNGSQNISNRVDSSNYSIPARNVDISEWLLAHRGGAYSVSLYDQKGNSLVDANSNQPIFMASIYKLYVAYIGYQKLDEGTWLDDVNYFNDWSRSKCLDEMIRSSHSPCGERMMAEIGKTNIQAKLDEYGLENTSFKLFETSSADVANLLIRLQNGRDLSQASRQKMLDSMQGQTYRDALPSGFSGWKVYDKVGFRDQDEYHDVGIVVNSEGEWYVLSVMTRNAGTNNIADLARTIRTALQ